MLSRLFSAILDFVISAIIIYVIVFILSLVGVHVPEIIVKLAWLLAVLHAILAFFGSAPSYFRARF